MAYFTKYPLRFFLLTALLITISACGESGDGSSKSVAVATLPGIAAFLKVHSDFGSPKSVEEMPNWARGERQQVRTTKGAHLFYLEKGEVVTVYSNDASGRKEVWRKPGS